MTKKRRRSKKKKTNRRKRDEDLIAPEIPLDPVVTEIVNRLPINSLAISTQRDDVLVAPEIPTDLIIEIIKRLPFKSLARFKCVSKLWFSLINSQGHLFDSPPRIYISWIHYFDIGLLSLASTSDDNTAFDVDFMIDEIGGSDLVSLRGLLLYKLRERACLYNPTTRQSITLPEIDFDLDYKQYFEEIGYFLGYDPVLDQYKVVCTVAVGEYERVEAQHWVYLLEAGSSWKRSESVHPHIHATSRLGLCCINGVLYYLAGCLIDKRVVISFDVRSEEFNLIQVPNVVYEYLDSKYVEIIEYVGKPTIFDYTHLWDSSVDLWVLEDAGKWSKKSVVLQPCHMHFFPKEIYFEVIGTTQNGEVILFPEYECNPYYILYYDLHKNDVRRVDIRGLSKFPTNMALMDTGVNIMHLRCEHHPLEKLNDPSLL